MLVLSRRWGEEIVIGSGDKAIRVVVMKGPGDCVKLGIDAPKEMPITREPKDQ
jgi:carbon storage regulator CsrA